MKVGPSEAETFWAEFLRSLTRLGLRGVKLVISEPVAGLNAAAAKVLKGSWQRCRGHFMRNARAHANETQRRMVSADIATAFAQETAKAARDPWRTVADPFRASLPKRAKRMDAAEREVLS